MRVVFGSLVTVLLLGFITQVLLAQDGPSEPRPLVTNHADPSLPSVLVTTAMVDLMTPRWKIEQSGVQFVISQCDADSPCDCALGILIPDQLGLLYVAIPESDHVNFWTMVAASYRKPRIWAIAEWQCEGASSALELIASNDGGATWRHTATLKKPYYMMFFHEFHMDTNGNGTISLVWEDSSIQPEFEEGLYTYRTNDWGDTWDGPVREPYVVVSGTEAHDWYDGKSTEHWRQETKELAKPAPK